VARHREGLGIHQMVVMLTMEVGVVKLWQEVVVVLVLLVYRVELW
jgi:hypothetical protein